MDSHVLLFILSEQCSSCHILASMMNGITNNLRNIYPTLRTESINIEDKRNIKIDEKINIGIKRFIVGNYPIIMLINGNEWNASIENTGSKFFFKKVKYFGKKWTERDNIISIYDEPIPGFVSRPTFRNSKHLDVWFKECLKDKITFPNDYTPSNIIFNLINNDMLDDFDEFEKNDTCPVLNIVGLNSVKKNKIFFTNF